MLFTQIIAFIVVMVVYESYRPAAPELDFAKSLAASAGVVFWLWLGVRLKSMRVLRRLDGPNPPLNPTAQAKAFILKAHLAAIVCLIICITLLDLKAHLSTLPLVESSETFAGLAAVLAYFIFLVVVWCETQPVEARLFGREGGRKEFVLAQVRFTAPVIFPWLLAVVLRDFWSLAIPGGREWLQSDVGDLSFIVVFLLLISLFFPPLVRRWWGCRPWPEGPVRELCQMVLSHAGVKVGQILNWPILNGKAFTAGVLGLASRFRYLLLTPALVDSLSPNELAAVVAHEAGHVRHRHLAYYLFFFLGFFIVIYALSEPLALGVNAILFSMADPAEGAYAGADGLFSVLMAVPFIVLMVVYLRFVMGFFMRHFERQADYFSLGMMGEAAPLADALEQLSFRTGSPRDTPSWHHFSVAQRVDALNLAQARPGLIAGHAAMLKKAFRIYLVCLALVAGLGYGFSQLDMAESLSRSMIIEDLRREAEQKPDDARLHLNLGVLLFQQGDEEEAFEALHRALILAPGDPEVLNGLAWFWATARDESLRNHKQALVLALAAVRISPRPHIWDTLAEAYYVNGRYDKAVAAAKAALAAGPKERLDYYREQLERFLDAADK